MTIKLMKVDLDWTIVAFGINSSFSIILDLFDVDAIFHAGV